MLAIVTDVAIIFFTDNPIATALVKIIPISPTIKPVVAPKERPSAAKVPGNGMCQAP